MICYITKSEMTSQLGTWLVRAFRRNAGQVTIRRRNQPIADIDHCFYAQVVAHEFVSEAIDVDVKAFGVHWLRVCPGVFPKIRGGNNSVRGAGQTREYQKLRAR